MSLHDSSCHPPAKQETADLKRMLRELEDECEHYKDMLGSEQQRSKDLHQDYKRKLQRATSATLDSSIHPQSITTM